MPRLLAASSVVLFVGATLVLSELRWFSRQPLVDRLRPYSPGGLRRAASPGGRPVGRVVPRGGRAARSPGGRAAGGAGRRERGARRAARSASTRRWTPPRSGCGSSGGRPAASRPGPLVAAATSRRWPSPCCWCSARRCSAFLVVEQQLATASDRWKRRVFLELPVLSEQLGMLIGAGYSLGSALNRLAARGSGACARTWPACAAGSARGSPRWRRSGSGRRSPTSTRSPAWWPCWR